MPRLLPVRRMAGGLTAAVVPLMVAAGPAMAATVTYDDPAEDTWGYDPDYNLVEAPGNPHADLTKFTVGHGSRKVVVTAKYVDLSKIDGTTTLMMGFRTNEKDVFRSADVTISSDKWKGASTIASSRGPFLRCGLEHKVDYAKDRIQLRIPRRCLSKPKWIRVSAGHNWSNDETTVMDNPHNTGTRGRWTGRIRR